MNRSRYLGSPAGDEPSTSRQTTFELRSSGSSRSLRATASGAADDLHSRKNGVYLPNRSSRGAALSTDKVHRSFGSASRIDPQVYTDTQSRGLTSRLASYYERDRLDLKPIVNRMYSKAGDLPIVHLHKNDVSANSASPRGSFNASRVRIPAPDRFTYLSNMRSEILRTGAMGNTPLLMSNASDPNPDTSFEVMAPLDALKEISRKRIHCDEVNVSNNVSSNNSSVDRVKKQRADEHEPSTSTGLYALQQPVSKRQRDTTSPTNKKQFPNESQKKRPCTKNNDVLSSLSSSVRFAANRKNFNLASPAVTRSVPSPKTTTVNRHTDISSSDSSNKSNEATISEVSSTRAECAVDQQRSIQRSDSPPKASAPKLMLFNQRYATIYKTTSNEPKKKDNNDDDDDCAQISFVKPKAGCSADKVVLSKRPAESSKLALMLSCLSGDLDDDDQVDTAPLIVEPKSSGEEVQKKVLFAGIASSLTTGSVTGSAIQSVGTSPTSSCSLNLPETTIVAEAPVKPIAIVSTVSAITTPVTTTLSTAEAVAKPVASFMPITSTHKSSEKTTFEEPKTVETSNTTFSFGSAKTAPTEVAGPTTTKSLVTTDAPKAVAASLSFGNISIVPTTSAITTTDPPKPFSFGMASTPASTTAVTETPKAKFSFGGNSASVAPISTAPPNTATEVAKSTATSAFSFGGSTASALPTFGSTVSATTFNPSTTPSVATPATNFSAVPKPSLLNTTTTLNAAPTSSAFGALEAAKTTTAFSFGASTQPSAGGFNFNRQTTSPPPVDPRPAAFAFGSTSQPPAFGSTTTAAFVAASSVPPTAFGATPATTQAPPAFGTTSSTVAPPAFGAPSTSTTSAPLSFGSFNLSTSTSAAAPKPGGFTFNPSSTTPSFATSTSVATPSFGSTTNATSLFGVPTTTTTASSSAFGAAATPSFGAPSVTSTAPVPSFGSSVFGAPSATPAFGAPVATTAPPAFGAPTFGAQPSFGAATTTTTASTFGSNAGPFGVATTTAPTFGSSTTPSFGTTPTAATTTPSFGSTTPAFGSNTPSFGSSSPFGASASKAAPPSFGAVPSSTGSNFFGSSAASANTTPSAVKPFAFGSSAAPAPSFGASSGSSSAFAFGSTASPAQQPSSPAPFGFNTTNTAPPAANSNASATPFAFGANAAPSFGGMASKIPVPTTSVKPFGMPEPSAAAAPPPFAFGASSPAPFAFGSSGSGSSNTGSASSTATGGAASTGGAAGFNFGTNLFSATPANGGTANAAAKGRPIRTATRRIFK